MDAFISGAWRTPRRGEVLIGGAWRTITRGEQYRSGAWKRIVAFTSPLSVTAFDVYGEANNRKPVSVTSQGTRATPQGGTGPYSYSWVITEGGATIVSPNMASTTFRQLVGPGQQFDSFARVTCTDALGFTAQATINIVMSNEGAGSASLL